jgi:hypothetical protein
MTSTDLLMTSNLKLVEVRQMPFGTDVGEEVRCVAEGWMIWTNAAVEQCRCHWERLLYNKQGE